MLSDVDPDSMAAYYLYQHIDDDDPDFLDEPYPTRCKFCNQGELHWITTAKGWRLANQNDVIHICDKYRRDK